MAAVVAMAPVHAQETVSAASQACSSMGKQYVSALVLFVLVCSFLFLFQVDRRLRRDGWTLAQALSEPQPTCSVPSTSRVIAFLGMIIILLLYLGFGLFTLYSYGMTCQLPASMGAVTGFLYAGLAFFAPYMVNKFSQIFEPFRRQPSVFSAPATSSDLPQNDSSDIPHAEAAETNRTPSSPMAPSLHPGVEKSPLASRESADTRLVQGPVTKTPLIAEGQSKEASSQTPGTGERESAHPYAPAMSMIASFEGFRSHAYPDPASGGSPWSIGYGFTTVDGRPVRPGDSMSREEADSILAPAVEACAIHLSHTIPFWDEMNENQRCALIDFAWNLGDNFYGDQADFASITRDLRPHDWQQVPQTLLLYCDPGTDVSEGLLRRRRAEGELWSRASATNSQPPSHPAADSPASNHHLESPTPNPLQVPYFDQLKT